MVFPVKSLVCLLGVAVAARAEVHRLTLQQAIDIASRQNPDVVLARLDEQRSQDDVRIAKNPFLPKVYGGSGLAYTYGYPNSIEGSAPSLFQLRTDMALFNKPDRYRLAAARELARGSQYGAQAKAEDVAFQTSDLFLSASQAEHDSELMSQQIPSLQKVVDLMQAGVSGGSQLPLDLKRATVNLAVVQQRLESSKLDADYDEMMLAIALGYSPADRVQPVDGTPQITAPASEGDAAEMALRNNRQLRQMQENVLAKQLDLRSYKAERLPKFDLVAQYALFDKQNYQQYFGKFQANNVQLGASITLPLLIGSEAKGMADEAAIDMAKMRIQMEQIRTRIISDTRRSYEQWEKAKSIRDLSRQQLDFARESLTVLLAQNGEGRVPMRDVEQARLDENERWMALYEAETQVTRAELDILHQMGTLIASIRATPTTNPATDQPPATVQP